MEADRPQIVEVRMDNRQKDKPKGNRCIQPPRPADAPEGSYFDWDDCIWRDSAGNPIGGGRQAPVVDENEDEPA